MFSNKNDNSDAKMTIPCSFTNQIAISVQIITTGCFGVFFKIHKNVTMTCFCRLSGDEKDLCIWGGGVYGGELNWIGFL